MYCSGMENAKIKCGLHVDRWHRRERCEIKTESNWRVEEEERRGRRTKKNTTRREKERGKSERREMSEDLLVVGLMKQNY